MSESSTAHAPAVRAEDLLPVASRIAWGPIFAGAAIALSLSFLFALLGGAIGFSIGGRVRGETLSTGAAVYSVFLTVYCLFMGGYFVSQFTVGENRMEAVLYGLIMWAVVFAVLLWLTAAGVRAGFSATMGAATAGGQAADKVDWEQEAKRQGVTQAQIDEWRGKASEVPGKAREAALDPQNQQAAADAATRVSWWAFGGASLSMLSAVAGSYMGRGRRSGW